MNTRFLGGSLAALLLALALAGCNGNNGGSTAPGSAPVGSPNDALATVGSTPITRGQLNAILEGIAGQRVLPELIDSQLLTESLKTKGGQVSEEEVTAEITRVAQNDEALKTAIAEGGARAQVPRLQVRRNLTVQKLLVEGIAADETKAKAFFSKFSSYYGTPAQNKIGILAATTKVRADQLARALQSKPDSFAALVEEQKKSNDQFAAFLSKADSGKFEAPENFVASNFANLPPQVLGQIAPAMAPVVNALKTAKKGQVLPAQALSPKGPFLIVRVLDRQEATKPDYNTLKDQVMTDYKMSVAAQAEIKKNPANPPAFEENVKRVAAGLAGQMPPGQRVTMRDILTYILQPSSQNLLIKLRTNGTVQISDPTYKDVAKAYAAAPATGTAGNTAAGTVPGPAIKGAPPASAPAPGAAPAPAAPAKP